MKKYFAIVALMAASEFVNAQVSEQVVNNYSSALNPESTMAVTVLNEDFHAEKPSRFNYWALEGYVGNSTRPTDFCEMQIQGWSLEASGVVNSFNGFVGFGPSVGLNYKTKLIRAGLEYVHLINRYNATAATPNHQFHSNKISGLFGYSVYRSANCCSELEIIGRVTFLMDGDDLAQEAEAEKASIKLEAYQHTYAIGGDGGFRYTQRFKGSIFYCFGQATVGGQGNLTYSSNKIQFIAEGKIGFGINLEGKKKWNQPALQMVELSPDQIEKIAKEDANRPEKRIYSVTR
jgi:hypothetical protein